MELQQTVVELRKRLNSQNVLVTYYKKRIKTVRKSDKDKIIDLQQKIRNHYSRIASLSNSVRHYKILLQKEKDGRASEDRIIELDQQVKKLQYRMYCVYSRNRRIKINCDTLIRRLSDTEREVTKWRLQYEQLVESLSQHSNHE